MAKIVQAAMKEPDIAQVVGTAEYTLSPNNLHESGRTRSNSNKMLPDSGDQFAYAYMLGGKTGYTDAAKHTFAGYAMKDGMRLISVVMGTTSDGKWLDTTKLMDYGFAAYERLSLAELYAVSPKTTNVQGAASSDDGVLQLDLAQELDPTTAYMVVSQAEKEDITATSPSIAAWKSAETWWRPSSRVRGGPPALPIRGDGGGFLPPGGRAHRGHGAGLGHAAALQPVRHPDRLGPVREHQFRGKRAVAPGAAGDPTGGAVPGLVVWLLIEIGRLKKERRIRRQRAREEAIRRRYEETRRNTRGPYESTVRIQRSRSAEDPYRAAPQRRGGQLRRRAPPGAAPAGACPWGRAGPIRAGDRRAIWEAFLQAWPARKPPLHCARARTQGKTGPLRSLPGTVRTRWPQAGRRKGLGFPKPAQQGGKRNRRGRMAAGRAAKGPGFPKPAQQSGKRSRRGRMAAGRAAKGAGLPETRPTGREAQPPEQDGRRPGGERGRAS